MSAVPGFDGPLLGGRYRLGPKYGKGSQGDVFLAVDMKAKGTDDREVIVKRLVPRGQWKSFELFEREAKVLSQLRHTGVPRHIATLEEPPGTFNLVMQRVPGENLRDLFARRRLSEVQLRDVLMRALEILDYLHTRVPPVIHRDLKPSNIVRAPDGKIALVDFGGVLDGSRDKGGSTIVGTFGYMAPEQLHGQATPATDIFALGCTIVALASGIEPEDVPRKGLRMDLSKVLASLDPVLRAALEAMTDPDPEQRPQRARDVVALLARTRSVTTPPTPKLQPKATSKAIVRTPGSALAPRKLFNDVAEPLATFLRLGVLSVGAAGFMGMAAARLGITLTLYIAAALAFPARARINHARTELDSLLSDGQTGFADMCRGALARH